MRALKTGAWPVTLAVLLGTALLAGDAFADFRNTRMGARPRAMGSAYVALADDASAAHWNAAGLVQEDRLQVQLTRNWMYDVSDQLRNDALTVDLPGFDMPLLGRVHTGVSFVRLGIKDVYYEDTYLLGAGVEVPWIEGLSFGGAAKVFRLSAPGYEQYDDPGFEGDDYGFSGDVGLLYDSGESWTLGANVYNVHEAYLQLISTTLDPDPVYRAFAVGGSYLFRDILLMTADVRSREHGLGDTTVNMGTEIWFYDALALRAGLFEGHSTMGVGLQDELWRADFALETHKELGDVYLLSFTLRN